MSLFCPLDGALDRVAARLGAHVYPAGFGSSGFYAQLGPQQVHAKLWRGSKHSPSSLKVQALLEPPLDLGLSVQSGATDVWGRFGPSFTVRADEPARAHALCPEYVQAALMHALSYTGDVDGRPRVVLDDTGLTVETSPTAQDDLPLGPDGYLMYVLEAAAAGAAATAHAARSVPVAASLTGLGRELADIARETSMLFLPTPLLLAGRRQGIDCRVRASRTHALRHELLVEARWVDRLGLGLSLGGSLEVPELLGILFHGRSRFQSGDPSFDSSFDVRVNDERRAASVFSEPARRRMLALRRLGPFAADDASLTLRIAAAGASGTSVLVALGAVSDAALALHGREPPAPSPYR